MAFAELAAAPKVPAIAATATTDTRTCIRAKRLVFTGREPIESLLVVSRTLSVQTRVKWLLRAHGIKVAPLNVDAANEEEIRLDLASESTNVAVARNAVAELAGQVGADVDSVKIAVGEAVGNAVLHAFRGSKAGTIRVRARLARGRLLVKIADNGIGMKPNPDSQGLRLGIPLITTLCDDVRFTSSDSGTFISMSFAAPGARA